MIVHPPDTEPWVVEAFGHGVAREPAFLWQKEQGHLQITLTKLSPGDEWKLLGPIIWETGV
jgi:hypothetical protein